MSVVTRADAAREPSSTLSGPRLPPRAGVGTAEPHLPGRQGGVRDGAARCGGVASGWEEQAGGEGSQGVAGVRAGRETKGGDARGGGGARRAPGQGGGQAGGGERRRRCLG